MKIILILFLGLMIISSCSLMEKKEIPPPPKEPCENVSLSSLPGYTHGFKGKKYDIVVIQTYYKNSKFDSLIDQHTTYLGKIEDEERQARSFNWPKSVTTATDIRLIFSDELKYDITHLKTEWQEVYCNDFCGYSCTVTSFKINGKLMTDGGNVFIKAPDFVYPWENKGK